MEAIEANFGLSPFTFDLEKYIDVSEWERPFSIVIESIRRNIERKRDNRSLNVHWKKTNFYIRRNSAGLFRLISSIMDIVLQLNNSTRMPKVSMPMNWSRCVIDNVSRQRERRVNWMERMDSCSDSAFDSRWSNDGCHWKDQRTVSEFAQRQESSLHSQSSSVYRNDQRHGKWNDPFNSTVHRHSLSIIVQLSCI